MRDGLKAAARLLALVAVIPALVSFRVRAAFIGPDRALVGSTQALALLPGLTGIYLRRAFLSQVLAECASSATIEFGVLFSQAGARIGPRAYIGPRCHIGLAHIGQDVLLAAGVHIPSGAHTHGAADLSIPIRDQPGTLEVVRIGEGAWVGSAAVVMADVGAHTIVAASAVVNKPLPAYVIAGGIPAKVIRPRDGVSGAAAAPDDVTATAAALNV
jgi:virginiamycin A acetyltransferase